jgi:hypothetical protein
MAAIAAAPAPRLYWYEQTETINSETKKTMSKPKTALNCTPHLPLKEVVSRSMKFAIRETKQANRQTDKHTHTHTHKAHTRKAHTHTQSTRAYLPVTE